MVGPLQPKLLSRRIHRQRGVALILMLAILVMGVSYTLVRSPELNVSYQAIAAAKHDLAVLQEAKAALIGAVAAQAAINNEAYPGRLPCPEAAGDAAGANAGLPANWSAGNPFGSCAATAAGVVVGRFPWRAAGIAEPRDRSGSTLWYAVSTNWVQPASGSVAINSNTAAGLSLDGQEAIAVIFAPGAELSTQVRTSSTPGAASYLDAGNASPLDTAFVTGITSTTFNDKVVPVSPANIVPVVEAVVAKRIANEIAPLMNAAYSGADWGSTTALPFALSFADPSDDSSYADTAAAATQGILPLAYLETAPNSGTACTPSAADPRCNPMFVRWLSSPAPSMTRTGGQAIAAGPLCEITTTGSAPSQTTNVRCQFLTNTNASTNLQLVATASNVGKAFRRFNTSATMTDLLITGRSASGVLNANGSATITLRATSNPGTSQFLPASTCQGFTGVASNCYYFDVYVPIYLLADHPVVDANDSATGWFLQNKWNESAYYAVAPSIAPGGSHACSAPPTTPSCLQVANLAASGTQRGIIILTGRSLSSTARPNGTLSDWLEGGNADGITPFEYGKNLFSSTFNDRVVVVDQN